jgi:CubicO group peptidase (beta-lactamase class C family)
MIFMMRQVFRLSLLLILVISFGGCRKKKSDVLYERKYIDEIKAARKDAIFYMTRNVVPGATFAIAKEGKFIYSEGMGLASADLEVPVTRSTKFRIGEISELFTSLIYQKMIDDRLLHPDSSVQFYLTDFPEKQFKLPLYHLAYHTSGIRIPSLEESDWRAQNVSVQAGLETFMKDPLLYPPGAYQVSSIFNYNLLGAVMEKVSGESFNTILAKYVTDTLGLENTLVDNPFMSIRGRANHFDHNFIAQVVPATFRDLRYKAPSQGILSNAEDLVKFGNALLYSGYFTEVIKDRLFEPFILPNGLPAPMAHGWILMEDRYGRKMYGKSGTVTGGSAALLIYPEEKIVVACATNLSLITEDFPLFAMAGHFLNDQQPGEKGHPDSEQDN